MVKTEAVIAVEDIPESAAFYQTLLGCKSEHGAVPLKSCQAKSKPCFARIW